MNIPMAPSCVIYSFSETVSHVNDLDSEAFQVTDYHIHIILK